MKTEVLPYSNPTRMWRENSGLGSGNMGPLSRKFQIDRTTSRFQRSLHWACKTWRDQISPKRTIPSSMKNRLRIPWIALSRNANGEYLTHENLPRLLRILWVCTAEWSPEKKISKLKTTRRNKDGSEIAYNGEKSELLIARVSLDRTKFDFHVGTGNRFRYLI